MGVPEGAGGVGGGVGPRSQRDHLFRNSPDFPSFPCTSRGEREGGSWNRSHLTKALLFSVLWWCLHYSYVLAGHVQEKMSLESGFFLNVWVSLVKYSIVRATSPTISLHSCRRAGGGQVWKSLDCFCLFALFWRGELFWLCLPIRCKFPGTQFILGLLQFVFSLFQFGLHFEEN